MIDDIIKKRAILLTTKLRFSPKTQSLKEKAIDKMVEQILYTQENEVGMTLLEVQENSGLKDYYYYSLNIDFISSSLKRLLKENRIIEIRNNGELTYKLTNKSRSNLEQILFQAEKTFNNILEKLFKNTSLDKDKYSQPFFTSLCIIFSKLGEENISLITGDFDDEKFNTGIFSETLNDIKREFPWIDIDKFKNILITFFYDTDREYGNIKWNMAQSYYISKSLGLEGTNDLLSEHIFEKSSFYIDTNLIIPAIEQFDRNHKGFLTFYKACKKLGIELNICEITLVEFENWLAYQYDLLKKLVPLIPEETYEKINSSLLKIYKEKLKNNKDLEVEDFFGAFSDSGRKLKNYYGVNVINNNWFDKKVTEIKTQQIARKIQQERFIIKGRQKRWDAALHDATILLWIENLRKCENKNIWFATLDTTLPGVKITDENYSNLSITLGALLQWIAPFTLSKREEGEFYTIFAEIVKNRLLPQEQLFDLKDFMIFKNLEIDCKTLPAQDVERCLESLKVNAPNLNPNNPSDLIKLSYEVERFFLDTGRKYKSNEEQLKQELNKSELEKDKILKEFENLKNLNKKKELKRSAINKLRATLIIQLVITGAAIYLINIFGAGKNLFQKISNNWEIVAATFTFFFIGGYFIIGKERLKALGWKFEKVFKAK